MAGGQRKGVVASKDGNILGVVSPPRHGPAAGVSPQALEPRSTRSGRSSKCQTTEEAPHRTGKVLARSRRGSRSDVAEQNAVSPVSSAPNTFHKSFTPNKGSNVAHHATPLPSNTPVSLTLHDNSKKHAQIHARPRRSSKSETPERPGHTQAYKVFQGQKAVATADSLESKVTRSGKKEESQQYLIAPEPVNAAPENAKDSESQLDEDQMNLSWPCLLCVVALLVTLAFLVLLFMLESAESLASLERTTTTSVIVAYTTAAPDGREIIESADSDTSVCVSTDHTKTAAVTRLTEDKDSDSSMALALSHQTDGDGYITST